MQGRKDVRPALLYHDTEDGDVDQAALLTSGMFRFGQKTYRLPLRSTWQYEEWPDEVKLWLYSFEWLKDLRTLGSNGARLLARALVASWAVRPPSDSIARDGKVIGRRLANWMGHYDFCLSTATEETQKLVMDAAVREGRRLSALLPLPPSGWEGLAALRGLLAVFMAAPQHDGFFKRFQRQLPLELERLILPDGVVVERSPEAQYRCVQELTSLLGMFTALKCTPPDYLPVILGRVCSVLRAFCHGDGGLALFNGSQERSSREVEGLLEQAERYRVVAPNMAEGGFLRLAQGRALLLVDAAAPPARGFDARSHAGTLSFEFSHHKQRLFVNCGSCVGGAWKRALRSSAAHTVLVVEGDSSSDFNADGRIVHRPAHVQCRQIAREGGHEVHLSHDGYYPSHGVVWARSLFLEDEGEELRGYEIVEGERDVSFMLRFHVHPDVRVTQEDEDILLHTGDEIWRFRQTGGTLFIEDDQYMGRGLPESNAQIVVASRPGRFVAVGSATSKERPRRQQKVEWVLERVPL